MTDRTAQRIAFKNSTLWQEASAVAMAGDASGRRYHRLFDPSTERSAILMDAPPEAGEDVRPFLRVAAYLRDLGLSAPEIFAADQDQGFLILEDFGENRYDRICADHPDHEPALYDAAVDVLLTLSQAEPLEDLADFRPDMTEAAMPCYDWYAAPVTGDLAKEARAETADLLRRLIDSLGTQTVTALRDYHAQNLLWLPERQNAARVGVLDFQDAVLCHPAYDLISLTTDARRDVSDDIADRCLQRMTDGLQVDAEKFARDAAICSVQRNLRILMIFARMSLHFARPHYLDLLPRVWRYLQRDLDHPDLRPLAIRIRTDLPEPTPDTLKRLKSLCGTVPTLQ